MKCVVQRVNKASVNVDSNIIGKIERGLLVFLGVTHGDTEKEGEWLSKKVIDLRIFEDEAGKMNKGLKDIGGEILVVSQFTLYGNCQKGRRPSFVEAARPDIANDLYEKFIENIRSHGVKVESGQFGADMKIELTNDGPVTLIIDTDHLK